MTFSENYLTHLRVLQNVGMTGIEPIERMYWCKVSSPSFACDTLGRAVSELRGAGRTGTAAPCSGTLPSP